MVCVTGSSPSAGRTNPVTTALKSMSLPGSTASASGSPIDATDSAPPRPPDGHSRRATTNSVSPRASVESASSAGHDTSHGTTASGTIVSAANGG